MWFRVEQNRMKPEAWRLQEMTGDHPLAEVTTSGLFPDVRLPGWMFPFCFLKCGSRPRQRSGTQFLEGRLVSLSQLVSISGRKPASLSSGSLGWKRLKSSELPIILYSTERLPFALTRLGAVEEFCSEMRNLPFEKLPAEWLIAQSEDEPLKSRDGLRPTELLQNLYAVFHLNVDPLMLIQMWGSKLVISRAY